MNDDLDLEKELAKSIAHIVDEETSGAEVFVKSASVDSEQEVDETSQKTEDVEEYPQEDIQSDPEEPDDEITRKKKIKHMIIMIVSIVAAIAIIGVSAYFIVRYAYKSSKDNFAYYNNAGYTAWDEKDYEAAAKNFEKALTYEEGNGNTDMMMFLYECYINTDREEDAVELLYDVLEFNDKHYYNALYYLVEYYDDKEDYESIKTLYDENKDSDSSDVLSLFSIYQASEPVASPVGDTYSDDQSITLAAKSDCEIYYTLDGTEPTEYSTKYTGKIDITDGTTTLKFIAVNEYGFASHTVTEEYVISYQAPSAPTIYPENTSFKQSSDVMVTINNIPAGSTAYYTTDGSVPNEDSNVYTGPFALKEGSTIINVLVVDSHGLTCRTSKTYNVTYISNVTESDALNNIWNKLIEKKIVDEEHCDDEGKLCELQYYTKKTVDSVTVYMYYFSIDGERADYWYAADDSVGAVYKITGEKDNYTLKQLN